MYESFFQFKTRPFAAAPLVESYYPAGSIEQAKQTSIRAIERAEGPVLVIGPAGVGKSLLCRLLAVHFADRYCVALLSSTQIFTRKALLQNILFELGLPYRDMDEGELRLSLIDHLHPRESLPHGMLLIVDEAHTLPIRLLEEIRMITNLVRDGQPRVRLILAGGTRLDERFASPKIESFNQRVAARCYLQPLEREETCEYVRSHIALAGGVADEIFSEDAYRAISRATDGIPRLVNQICNHALTLACDAGLRRLDAASIEEAWADLQQLPTPWQETGVEADTANAVIEFGQFEEDRTAATDGDMDDRSPPPPDQVTSEPPTVRFEDAAVAEGGEDEPGGDRVGLQEALEAAAAESAPPQVEIVLQEAEASFDVAFDEEELAAATDGDMDDQAPGIRDEAAIDSPTVPFQGAAAPQSGNDVSDCDRVGVQEALGAAAAEPASPQVEIVLQEAVDPFDMAFDEEEIVVDHYAVLAAKGSSDRPGAAAEGEEREENQPWHGQVQREAATAATEREPAAAQDRPPANETPVAADVESGVVPLEMGAPQPEQENEASPACPQPACAQHPQPHSGESHTFEYTVFQTADELTFDTSDITPNPSVQWDGGQADESVQGVSVPWRPGAPVDDWDLIEIQDGGASEDRASSPPAAPDRACRLEYQELFAQLRQID